MDLIGFGAHEIPPALLDFDNLRRIVNKGMPEMLSARTLKKYGVFMFILCMSFSMSHFKSMMEFIDKTLSGMSPKKLSGNCTRSDTSDCHKICNVDDNTESTAASIVICFNHLLFFYAMSKVHVYCVAYSIISILIISLTNHPVIRYLLFIEIDLSVLYFGIGLLLRSIKFVLDFWNWDSDDDVAETNEN